MPIRLCLGCGAPIRRGSRCTRCTVRSDSAPGWAKLRLLVLRRDDYTCHYCGGPANTVDHVDAASKQRRSTNAADLVAACQPCNSSKRDSTGGRSTP